MSHDDEPDAPRRLDDVLDGLRIAMVTTVSDGALRARPLTVLEVDGQTLRFLVAGDAEWIVDIEGRPSPAQASFAYPDENMFVALSCTARVSRDRSVINRLWTPAATAFFEDADDPRITVLELAVESGEYWDGPSGGVGQALAFVRAVVTGEPGDLGEHGEVRPR